MVSRWPADPYCDGPATAKPGEWIGWDLRLLSAVGGQTRTLATVATGGIHAQWSPDSRWVFADLGLDVSPNVVEEEIRLIDTTTGESRKLAGPTLPANGATWSRDSRQLVYQARNAAGQLSFWTTTVDGTEVRPWTVPLDLAKGAVNLALGMTRVWTTDNRVLVRQQDPSGFTFYLVPAAGGAAEKACELRQGQSGCAVTPDGRVRVTLDATERLMLFDLGNVDAPRRLTTAFGREASPAISPDGRLVAFASNADGKWELQVVPIDRAPAEALRAGPLGSDWFGSVAWTPAGRLVGKVTTENQDIYRINLDATGRALGAPARLTQDTRDNNRPSISPDGRHVAYAYDGLRGLAVMTADGAAERPILMARNQGPIAWRSADEVVFRRVPESARNHTGSLSSLNIKTGVEQMMVDLPAGVVTWQFVASKNEVFYAVPPPGAAGSGAAPTGVQVELRARSVSTGADRLVVKIPDLAAQGPARFRVSPDGAHVAYVRFAKAGNAVLVELHLMAIDGQGDRVIAMPGGPSDWSPDGRRLLYFAEGGLRVFDVLAESPCP